MRKPGTSHCTKNKMPVLIAIMKSPRVNTVIGKVKITINGFITALTRPNNKPEMIKVSRGIERYATKNSARDPEWQCRQRPTQ